MIIPAPLDSRKRLCLRARKFMCGISRILKARTPRIRHKRLKAHLLLMKCHNPQTIPLPIRNSSHPPVFSRIPQSLEKIGSPSSGRQESHAYPCNRGT
ncbi:unnamed protein product [Periconia digitata]|uniref:Uncharacterized protein n=1 Tax=Periconia digitata TaxID=1303443 RepID=A0A9W4U1N8_9PLEO|nr:unnamed protein product [Periconia digitata]